MLKLSEINDEFAYTIKSLSGVDKYPGLKLLPVYEYRISDVGEVRVGVYLGFGGCGLSVTESDECLSVTKGVVKFSDSKISLHKLIV